MNIESTNVGGTIVCVGIVEHYGAVNIEIWQNHAPHTRRIARNPYTNGIDDENRHYYATARASPWLLVGNTLNGRAQQSTSNTSKLPRKAAVQKRKKPETEVSGFRHHH